nr:beta-glucuronidase [Limosilactobacillus mucosae]
MLYPEQTVTRTLEDLSGLWKFQVEDQEIDPKQALPNPMWMAVPASFNDQIVDRKLHDHIGWFWYETKFNIPVDQMKKRNVLHFGSVTQNCEIYVNGLKIAEHIGGFTPFEVEIDKAIHEGENDLKVRFNNLLDNTTLPTADLKNIGSGDYQMRTRFDFFNYSGIHRRVQLYTTNRTYLDHIAVNYDVEGSKTMIHPDIHVFGNYGSAKIKVLDEDNQIIAQSDSLDGTLVIANTHRWQPMNSYLYRLQVELFSNKNELLDVYTQEFGVRTIEVKDHKFFINGMPFYFKGFGRHEDSLARGKGVNLPLVNLDYHIMKKMGANSFRTSHYPYDEEAMRLADRMGFVVIDEVPAVGLFENFNVSLGGRMQAGETWVHMNTMKNHKHALREMIERDHDHPSVVMWSVANEPASHEPGAHEYFKEIIDYTKKLDPQKRPVTVVNIMHADATKDLIGDLLDVVCLNRYYGWYVDFDDLEQAKDQLQKELSIWNEKFPDKPIIFTEIGADTVNGMHSVMRTPYSEEYQLDYYKANFEIFDNCDYVQGEQLWNFADFVTEPGMIRIGAENRKGVFTRNREPKLIAEYLNNRWNNFHKK